MACINTDCSFTNCNHFNPNLGLLYMVVLSHTLSILCSIGFQTRGFAKSKVHSHSHSHGRLSLSLFSGNNSINCIEEIHSSRMDMGMGQPKNGGKCFKRYVRIMLIQKRRSSPRSPSELDAGIRCQFWNSFDSFCLEGWRWYAAGGSRLMLAATRHSHEGWSVISIVRACTAFQDGQFLPYRKLCNRLFCKTCKWSGQDSCTETWGVQLVSLLDSSHFR